MTVHDARRVVRSGESRGIGPDLALLFALVIAAGSVSVSRSQDPPTTPAKPAFEAGDISIGEPIALPFARPKAVPETTAAASGPAPSATPGQGWLGIKVAESAVPGRWTVDEVAPKSPAMAAGINPGDEVRAIGGLPLRNADDVAQALTSIAPGQDVRLAIGRGEQVSDVTLTAVPRPLAAAKALQGLPPADSATAVAPPAEPLASVSVPPAAATGSAAQLAAAPTPPTVTMPSGQPLATLPVAPPASSLPTAPPVSAFAVAPLDVPAVSAEPTPPRFPQARPPAEPVAPVAERFEPVAPAATPEPVARVGQAAPQPVGRIALGVRTIPIDTGLQARFNLPAAAGAYVIGVVGDLPASKAGVPPGSVIVALDERPVRSPDELTRLVTSGPIGKPVPLEYVLPGGTSRRAEVVLQALEQPLEEALVGPPSPTATTVPTLQPQPTPTTARRPAATAEATALRDEIQRLEARLEALERRLSGR